MTPGPTNTITDVPGVLVGNAHDPQAVTGVTVVIPDPEITPRFCAAQECRGGGPATRDTDALSLTSTVDEVHALVLSGGSGLGLDAAGAVQTALRDQGKGLAIAGQTIPIVPQAILFDMANGGDKSWSERPPYARLAREALGSASRTMTIGSQGAGFGATTADLRGGLGSASITTTDNHTVGALVAVNAVGSVTFPDTHHFLAAPYEHDGEFGGHGLPSQLYPTTLPRMKSAEPQASTTLAVVATNTPLSKTDLKRIAIMANTGMAHAIQPVHTPFDGDIVFALSTGSTDGKPPTATPAEITLLGHLAACTLARAIARAVFSAAHTPDGLAMPPAYSQRFAR